MKVNDAAFKYLLSEKNKQFKIAHIQYAKLEMEQYLLEGNRRTEISKLIYKARGKTLDIKSHKKWKYEDDICVGCGKNTETENLILSCEYLSDKNQKGFKAVPYSLVYSNAVSDMIDVASQLKKRLKIRQKILEEKS